MSKLGATEELLEAETRSGTDEKACGRLTYDWVVADYHPAHLNRYPERRVEWRGGELEGGGAGGGGGRGGGGGGGGGRGGGGRGGGGRGAPPLFASPPPPGRGRR